MTTDNGVSAEEKEYNPEAVAKSVQEFPQAGQLPALLNSSLFWFVSQASDEIEPWGRNMRLRDRQLREFLTTESIFTSALGIVCSRNSAFRWSLEGPEEQVKKYQRVLEDANFGKGWTDLVMKVSIDLYTQDNGAFIEIIRTEDSETAEVIGIAHLDAARCFHTGNDKAPVIYQDRKGNYHLMKWYQVIPLAEMPTGIEGFYGLQYCALTRLLRGAQVAKNIAIYEYERTGGLQARAIHLVKGITASQVQDAIDEMKTRLLARGNTRYAAPLVVGSVDPKADIGHDTLEMASLPDGFNKDLAMKWYLSEVAMAFLEDYQTFAPLPGGNLGSSQQSEVLALKARGKGPGLFRSLMTHAFNFQVFPENLRFTFDEQDLTEEESAAKVRKLRAEERKLRVEAGELTPEAVRQVAVDDGDLSQELFEALGGADVTPDVTIEGDSSASSQLGGDHPIKKLPTTQPIQQAQPAQPKVVQKELVYDDNGRIKGVIERHYDE